MAMHEASFACVTGSVAGRHAFIVDVASFLVLHHDRLC